MTFKSLIIVISLLNLFTLDAFSAISGRLYTDHYFSIHSAGKYQNSISSWINYDAKLSENTLFNLVAQGDLFFKSLAEQNKVTTSTTLREAYFSYQNDSSEFRLGQQIIPWGKCDGVNPTDFFSAKNYTTLNPDEEVKRIGAPALMVNYTPKEGKSPISFTGIFQAAYPQTKLIIPDQSLPNGIFFQKNPTSPSFFQSDSIEFGLKVSYLKTNYDFSLSAFRGVNHVPQYIFDAYSNKILPINTQQTAFGADGSFSLGNYIIRTELAYFDPDQGSEGSSLFGLVQPSHLELVVGAEHTYFDHFQAQIQGLYRYQIGLQAPTQYYGTTPTLTLIQRSVAQLNSLLLNYQQQSNIGGTFRIGYTDESSHWNADLFLLAYFTNGTDFLVRAQISNQVIENLKITLGSDVYGGNESRPLGALKKNSSIFLDGRYLF